MSRLFQQFALTALFLLILSADAFTNQIARQGAALAPLSIPCAPQASLFKNKIPNHPKMVTTEDANEPEEPEIQITNGSDDEEEGDQDEEKWTRNLLLTVPLFLKFLVHVVLILKVATTPIIKKYMAKDSSLISFLSGGVGGIAAVVVGHPFDLVKVRLQTGAADAAGGSFVKLMQRTLASEGIGGLYRGVSAPLLAVSPIFAISFWGYDIGQRIVKMFRNPGDDSPLSLLEISCAGGISAFPMTVVMAPMERLKCLMQVQSATSGGKQFSGLADCARHVYAEGGIRSVYKGTILTLARDIPGSIAWYATYEIMKREIAKLQGLKDPKKLSLVAIMVAGGFAGMACWGAVIPFDVLKSRYQTSPEGKYSSIVAVYRDIVKEEGHGGLLKGFRPAMARAFPANAACFMAMELSRSALNMLAG